MDYIAASNDRVAIHQALKHLIVSGNALIFMGKDGLKTFPLNRYVVNRDGNGNVLEIVTKELISRKVLDLELPEPQPNTGVDESSTTNDDVTIYTYVKLDKPSGRWVWHQEAFDKIILTQEVPHLRKPVPGCLYGSIQLTEKTTVVEE